MPTLYTCTDTEAPTPPQSGDYSEWFDAYCNILRGCLVTGYGSKPAAGWEEVHFIQHRTLSLQPANKLFTLTLVNLGTSATSTNGLVIFLSESVTEYPTSWGANQRPIGNNVRSGYYSPDTNPTGSLHGFRNSTTHWVNWSIVADGNTFALYRGGWSNSSAISSTYGRETYLYVGEVSSTLGMGGLAASCAAGGNIDGGISSSSSHSIHRLPWGQGSTFLRNPLTGLITNGSGTRIVVPPYESMGSGTNYSTENITIETGLDSLDMIRTPAHYGTYNAFGYLKGVAGVPTSWWTGYGTHVAKALGLSDQTTRAREWFGVPVTLEDGFEYSLCGSASWPTLLTTNPDFW